MDSTGIDNEEMAAYRNEVRSQYKVVWTVIFTEKCKSRTDATFFFPSSHYINKYSFLKLLSYIHLLITITIIRYNYSYT